MVSGAILFHNRVFKYLFGANQLSEHSENHTYEKNGVQYSVSAVGIQGFRHTMEDSHTIKVIKIKNSKNKNF